MTLRKVCFLLLVLVLAAGAQADPMSLPVAGTNNPILRSMSQENFHMATTLAAARHDGQLQQFVTAGPTIPAPEPATLALFGTGLIGVATLVRLRTRRSRTCAGRR